MKEENIRELQVLLENLRFSGRTAWKLEAYKKSVVPSFELCEHRSIGEDLLLYFLQFTKDRAGSYQLKGYDLLLTSVAIPDVAIRGVHSLTLEADLKQVERYYDLFGAKSWSEGMAKKPYDHMTRFITRTNATLERLASWKKGLAFAKLLMFKYWPRCRYQLYFSDYSQMENCFRARQHFPLTGENALATNQSYQHVKQIL